MRMLLSLLSQQARCTETSPAPHVTVNNFHCFVIIKRIHVFVSEDHTCYPLEMKLLSLLLLLKFETARYCFFRHICFII